ncbi:MAG: OsmC family protein, partial [Anaerolineae bacterium]
MSMLAKVTWVEDRRFMGSASSGHAVVVDASTQKQGSSPMELVLIGMAGCTAYDVMNILEKKRQVVTGLEVTARAERADEPPKVYTRIDVEYI